MNYWDDYYEPSEFDIMISEFKQSIVDNTRQEIKERIQKLEKENAELQEVKKNWNQIKKEHESAIRELRYKTENAEKEAKKQRVADILKSIAVKGYRPDYIFENLPKCNKCDVNRRIHYVSPMGRKMTEECECAKRKIKYFPKEVKCLKINVGNSSVEGFYFELCHEDSYQDTWTSCSDFYESLPESLDSINGYRAVFLNEEECKKYCDWMNEKDET